MHFQIWKSENGEDIKVEVYETTINCNEIHLPVMTNYSDDSEQSIIQLREIYDKYINFMLMEVRRKNDNALGDRFELLPYTIVDKLNKLSEILYNYLLAVGVCRFLPEHQIRVNIDPRSSTPQCQYMFEGFKEEFDKINSFLSNRGLYLDIPKNIDTDFGASE